MIFLKNKSSDFIAANYRIISQYIYHPNKQKKTQAESMSA